MRSFSFNDVMITDDSPPFVIAEIGVNYYDIASKYNISLMKAIEKMIKGAKKSGADAVKFQSYKAEKLASKFSPSYWDLNSNPTTSQYELFKKYDKISNDDWNVIAKYCKEQSITFLCTAFDFEAVDFIDDLVPIHKIASADITHKPLLEYIAEKKKPILLSTGASNISEISMARRIIKNVADVDVCLLHCILSYPTKQEDANLSMIKYLKRVFPNDIIGYSDHTIPDKNMILLSNSVCCGAKIIEKHFTLDKSLEGNDHFHAMDEQDLNTFISNIKILHKTYGQYCKDVIPSEIESRKYARRSIVVNKNVPSGTIITSTNVDFKRPGTGISPMNIEKIYGKKINKHLKEDEIVSWKDIG
jgi:sialic acid synthase SpsE